jgi:hypothetical protein
MEEKRKADKAERKNTDIEANLKTLILR